MDWKWIVLMTIQFLLIHSNCDGKEIVTQINTKKWIHYVPERFLSMTIDPLTIAAASPLSSESLNMAKGLTPSFVRISGKGSNYLHFGKEFLKNNSTVSEEQFDSVNQFVRDAGLDMIVSLNPMTRIHGVWDSSNALEMISYADKKGYHAAWQLGYDTQGLNATGGEIGRDVISLRKILDGLTRYSKSPVFGPDITTVYGDQQLYFLKELLAQTGPILSAIVLSPKMEDYKMGEENLISKLLDELDTYIWNKEISRNGNLITRKPVWIANIVFIADSAPSKGTFREAQSLAKKLGSAAKLGCQLVLRQPGVDSLKHPTPDFWFSLMYKTLVGRGVLESKIVSGNRTDVHVYSHCTPSLSQDKSILDTDWNYEKGTITIFGVNESPEPFKLTMKASIKEELIHIYSLTSTDSGGLNHETLLNGQLLTLSPSGDLPVLSPKVKKASRISSVTLPGHSIFFIVMPEIKVRTCSATPLMSPDINDLSKRLKLATESEKIPEVSDTSEEEPVYVKFSKRKVTESGTRITRLDQIHSKYRNFAKSLFPQLSVKQHEKEKQEVQEISSDDLPVKYITFNENSWLNKLTEAVGQMDTMKEDIKSSEEKYINTDKAEKYAVLATAIIGADSNYTDDDRINSRMKRSSTEANPISNINLNKINLQKQSEELLKELNSYSGESGKIQNSKSNRPENIFNTLKQVEVTFSNLDNEQLQSQQPKRIRVRQTDDGSKHPDDIPSNGATADSNSNNVIESMTKEKQSGTGMANAATEENKSNEDDEATIPDRILLSEAVKDNGNTDENGNNEMMGNINENITNGNSEVETADGNESKDKEDEGEKEEIINEQPLLVQESSEESMEEPTAEISSRNKQSQDSTNLKTVMEPQADSEKKENDLKEVIDSENDQKEAINSEIELKDAIKYEHEQLMNERMRPISLMVNEEILPENQPQTDSENELLKQRHIQKITPHSQEQKRQFTFPDTEQHNIPTKDALMTSSFINVDNDGQHLMNSNKERIIDSILAEIVNIGDAEYADKPVHPSREGTVEESRDNNYPLVEVAVPDTTDKVYVPSHPKNNGFSNTENPSKQVLDPGNHLMFPTDDENGTPKVQRQVKGGLFPKLVKDTVTPNLQETKVDTNKTPDRSEAMKAFLEGRKERMDTLKMKLEQSRKRILEATSKMNLNEEIKSSIKRREVELKNIFNRLDQSETLEDGSSLVKLVAIPVPEEMSVPEDIPTSEEILSGSLEEKSRPRRLSKDDLSHSYYNNDNKNIPQTFDNFKEEKIYEATKSHNHYLFPLDTKIHGIVYNNKIYPAKLFGVIDVNEDGKPNMNEKWSDISQIDEISNNKYQKGSGYQEESQVKLEENKLNSGPNNDNEYNYYNVESSKRKDKEDNYISVVILPPKEKLSVIPMSVKENERKKRSTSDGKSIVKESYVNKFNTNQFREKTEMEQKRSKREIEDYHPNSLKYHTKKYSNNYRNVSGEKYKYMILKKMEKEGKDLFTLAKKYNALVENSSKPQESINSENDNKNIESTEKEINPKEISGIEETTIGTCEEIGNSKESIIRDTLVTVTEESNKEGNLSRVDEGSTESPIQDEFASFIVERMKDFLYFIKQVTSNWGKNDESNS